jgi:hypothetical protein
MDKLYFITPIFLALSSTGCQSRQIALPPQAAEIVSADPYHIHWNRPVEIASAGAPVAEIAQQISVELPLPSNESPRGDLPDARPSTFWR